MWDAHKEDKERRRFVDEGLNKRPPVLAVAGIFLAVWLGGWGCSALLLALGMDSFPARYALSTLVSYGIFFGLAGVWCHGAAKPEPPGQGSSSYSLDGLDIPTDTDSAEGCLIVVVVLAIAGLLSGVFWLLGGYALLFEVAFEVAFAGTMVSRLGKRDTLGNWAGALLRRTWLPALVVGLILITTGAKLQHDHPEARTLSQAVKAHRAMQK